MILVDTRNVIPISVTGPYCPMNCKHCGGVYLKHMIPINKMEDYARQGNKVFLISGGMLPNGEIPFKPHESTLKNLKEKYKLRYNFHIGFPEKTPEIVNELADVVSADFFADPEVMKEVYGLSRAPDQILKILKGFSKPVVPHVTIGILCGKISHEPKALDILSENFDSIVLNVFIPTPGTAYENCPAPDISEVTKLFKESKKKFRFVFLGCMQPKGSYRKKLQERLYFIDGITKPVVDGERELDCCAFSLLRLKLRSTS